MNSIIQWKLSVVENHVIQTVMDRKMKIDMLRMLSFPSANMFAQPAAGYASFYSVRKVMMILVFGRKYWVGKYVWVEQINKASAFGCYLQHHSQS